MFSQTSEYALRAVVRLGERYDDPLTTRELADATQAPASYLSKVLQTLRRAGLVLAARGLHGGFALARPPAGITVLEVVEAVDPLPRIRSCPLRLAAHRRRLCPMHRKMDEAVARIEASFAGTRLCDLLEKPTRQGRKGGRS